MVHTLQKTSLLVLAGLLLAGLALLTPAAASPAGMQVYSTPTGANACLDGWWWQTTPATFDNIGNGWHTVVVYMDGYQSFSETDYVEDGTQVVNANLIRLGPTVGFLDITSEPNSADVYFDGTYYGNAPMVIGNLWVGNHKLVVRKAGYYDVTDSIPISSGQTYYYNAVLSAYPQQPATGSLQIDSTPGGAAIFLNGNYKGNTPASGVMYITELAPGTYNLRIVMQDYQPYVQSAPVTAGIINDIHATLVPVVQGTVRDTTGQILVSSSPSGANIYLDNAYKGISPLTLTNIPEGSHTVTLRVNGYQDFAKPVNVVGGSTVDVSGTLSSGSPANPTTPAPKPTKSATGWIPVVLALGICGVLFLARKKA
ncbi:PEGA domain-containing protein [uncultured Methanoregula sp.]|uniref:PEGA domain-containing protein n=1 Tax=uncultured Methanoregula sp. TaxID=1005933 RepID=UPI002AAA890B|nr:PEGA domain-containing protein [uncultured Methanoregula sp.]